GTYVEGIKEEVVLSPGHALSFIAAGEEHRHIGSNNFNLLSSRSHTIFTLIIDEKSLIKKYQREISALKLELDQLRRGMLVGVNPEEIMSLKQKLEEGQVKMQSRLEEEEEAKAALMSRIQRLTKLILVSSKNAIPGNDDNGSLLLNGDDLISSNVGSTITESTHAGEVISGSASDVKRLTGGLSIDEMDLLVERVKMLAGEIAFSTSTMKRLVEQSANDPENSKTQIEDLEREIEEKRRQMRDLEKQIVESNEASISNTSLADMQQTMMQLMTQIDEKGFELEIKSADNRILQEELQNKCEENKELQERIMLLEQQLAMANQKPMPSAEQHGSKEYIDGLRTKIKIQVITTNL
nr:kinesin-like protein KIN-7D, mitochondrial [Tanacetum cinerariifolium]